MNTNKKRLAEITQRIKDLEELVNVMLCERTAKKPATAPLKVTQRARSKGSGINSHNKWSAVDIATLKGLIGQNVSTHKIAQQLGRSKRAIATRILIVRAGGK